MTAHGFTLFDTVIGRCGIAWGGHGVVGIQLPEAREPETWGAPPRRVSHGREAPPPPPGRGGLRGAGGPRPPPGGGRALDGIVALLRGEASDLSAVALDMERVPPFHRRVYEVARTIPPGATLSYGEIAARLGAPGSARAVGQALGRNPFALVVPCHRVLAAGGKVGGFSANGGITTKLRLLAIEGVRAGGQPGLFDGDGALGFDPKLAVRHLRASDAALARVMDAAGPF